MARKVRAGTWQCTLYRIVCAKYTSARLSCALREKEWLFMAAYHALSLTGMKLSALWVSIPTLSHARSS